MGHNLITQNWGFYDFRLSPWLPGRANCSRWTLVEVLFEKIVSFALFFAPENWNDNEQQQARTMNEDVSPTNKTHGDFPWIAHVRLLEGGPINPPVAQFKSIDHSSPPSCSLRSSARTSQHDFWDNPSIHSHLPIQSIHLPPRDHSQPFQLSKAPTSHSSFHSSQSSSRPWPSQVLWFPWVPGWKIRGGQYSVEKKHKQTSKQQIRVDSI